MSTCTYMVRCARRRLEVHRWLTAWRGGRKVCLGGELFIVTGSRCPNGQRAWEVWAWEVCRSGRLAKQGVGAPGRVCARFAVLFGAFGSTKQDADGWDVTRWGTRGGVGRGARVEATIVLAPMWASHLHCRHRNVGMSGGHGLLQGHQAGCLIHFQGGERPNIRPRRGVYHILSWAAPAPDIPGGCRACPCTRHAFSCILSIRALLWRLGRLFFSMPAAGCMVRPAELRRRSVCICAFMYRRLYINGSLCRAHGCSNRHTPLCVANQIKFFLLPLIFFVGSGLYNKNVCLVDWWASCTTQHAAAVFLFLFPQMLLSWGEKETMAGEPPRSEEKKRERRRRTPAFGGERACGPPPHRPVQHELLRLALCRAPAPGGCGEV